MPRLIDGNNVLYHYIQKVLLARQDSFAQELVRSLILDLSIWLPVDLYRAAPVLFPYSLRDSSARSREWGSPSPDGYLRDNNSLLKILVGGYAIRGPLNSVYGRSGRGRNFTASHAWRRVRIDGQSAFSTAHPRTYSFIPNLAWLPAQVAKLTDHEGSLAQQLLQAISHRLYRAASAEHPPFLAGIWDSLTDPGLDMEIDPRELNTFNVSALSVKLRRKILLREIESILHTAARGQAEDKPVRSARYLPGLAGLSASQTTGLVAWLEAYRAFLLSE